ncbi:MAG: PEP-CTERM sorting domain-containing protein [Chthoniobacterales bacterium]
MKPGSLRICAAAFAIAASFFVASSSRAATAASDNAADPAYNSGWANNSNGGTGWGTGWAFNNVASDYSIGSSTSNANGDNGNPGGGIAGDGDIDTSGKAWGLSGTAGNPATAIRFFNGALNAGNSLSIQMDTGFIDNGGVDEFDLRDSSFGLFLQVLFTGGTSDYIVRDGAGDHDTGIAFTDEGLNIKIQITGLSGGIYSYNIMMNVLGGSVFNLSSNLNVPAPGSTITNMALISSAGAGADHILYFNNATVVPEPSTIALLGLGGLGLFLKLRQRV